MLRKAAGRGADALILDLEDGAHPDRKKDARALVGRLFKEGVFKGTPVFLRVNDFRTTPWGAEDLKFAQQLPLDAVVLPKAATRAKVMAARDVRWYQHSFVLMIETALGAANVFSLATTVRVAGLLLGAADFRASIGARATGDESELEFVRQRIVLAARAAGPHVRCWDSPWFAFRDHDGLERSARRARDLGFDGKSAVHPGQIPVIHRAFQPDEAEVERALRTIEALEAAHGRGESVAELDGELIEELHGRQARRVLALARPVNPSA